MRNAYERETRVGPFATKSCMHQSIETSNKTKNQPQLYETKPIQQLTVCTSIHPTNLWGH